MRFLLLFALIFMGFDGVCADIKHPTDFHKPFWKTKLDVQKKITQNDLLVVSADTEKIQEKPTRYEMKVVAGGIVRVPLDFAYKTITDYEKLKDVDDHFRESKYDKEKKTLFLHITALGYYAKMLLKINDVEVDNKDKVRQIHWECIEGQFLGMKGVFQVEEIERQKTEISMTAIYKSETLPLPKILMGLGLEVVGRQVAQKMRDYIFDQYKNK